MPMLTCSKCEVTKDSLCFAKDKSKKSGFYSSCKECVTVATKEYRASDEYIAKELNNRFKKLYGITLDTYNFLLEEQKHCCATCGVSVKKLKRKLAVDHNHTTGKVRGLLCSNCNTALGLVQENKETLVSLISYLETHNGT
jgi:hypothetical protein